MSKKPQLIRDKINFDETLEVSKINNIVCLLRTYVKQDNVWLICMVGYILTNGTLE